MCYVSFLAETVWLSIELHSTRTAMNLSAVAQRLVKMVRYLSLVTKVFQLKYITLKCSPDKKNIRFVVTEAHISAIIDLYVFSAR
jgi:hypothetical protein